MGMLLAIAVALALWLALGVLAVAACRLSSRITQAEETLREERKWRKKLSKQVARLKQHKEADRG